MHHTGARRGFAALLGLWFMLVSMDLPWLHACPMHGTAHDHAAPTAAHHAAHGTHAPASDEHAPRQGPCLCLGACQAGGAAVLPLHAVPAKVQAALARVATGVVATRARRRAVLATPHTLPFAHGPPVAHV